MKKLFDSKWEIFVSIAILAVIAVISIPHLLERGIHRSFASPISALRTISSAQELYNTKYASYGNLSELNTANMIDSVLAGAVSKNSLVDGFYYSVSLSADKQKWCCFARPFPWGHDSYINTSRNYLINETGIIYYNETENSSEFTTPLGG